MMERTRRPEAKETKPISTKQVTLHKAAMQEDYTLRKQHTIGQIVHNVHKLQRVLQKSNYTQRFGSCDSEQFEKTLSKGDPTAFSRIIKYLVFHSSSSFIKYLQEKNIDLEIEFLIDTKFIKQLTAVFIDLFKYRIQLSPEQFAETGYAERKIVLVLDIYDLIKQVKKQSKVQAKLTMKDTKWDHPCDLAVRQYGVVDHTRGTQKTIQFNINATLLKSKLTIQNEKKLESEEQQQASSADGDSAKAVSQIGDEQGTHTQEGRTNNKDGRDGRSQVYSITDHFAAQQMQASRVEMKSSTSVDKVQESVEDVAAAQEQEAVTNNKNDKEQSSELRPDAMINRGDKMGTSLASEEPAKEEAARAQKRPSQHEVIPEETSEESKSVAVHYASKTGSDGQAVEARQNQYDFTRQNQHSDNTRLAQDNAGQTVAGQQASTTDQQVQMLTMLTQSISQLGQRFEGMGNSFEQKLAKIESRHKELEEKIQQTQKHFKQNQDESTFDQEE